MATDYTSEFDDIPGTVVFTGELARQGFNLNQFCMSLMKPENRASVQGRRARLPGRAGR